MRFLKIIVLPLLKRLLLLLLIQPKIYLSESYYEKDLIGFLT